MGFPKDLENYKDHELEGELTRRKLLRQRGLCSYCRKPAKEHDRHSRAKFTKSDCRQHEVLSKTDVGFVLMGRRDARSN